MNKVVSNSSSNETPQALRFSGETIDTYSGKSKTRQRANHAEIGSDATFGSVFPPPSNSHQRVVKEKRACSRTAATTLDLASSNGMSGFFSRIRAKVFPRIRFYCSASALQ